MPARKRRRPKGVVDTSVLVAGIAGFKSGLPALDNPSALFLRNWIEADTFTWLISRDILSEYKGILTRCGVRRALIGNIINLLGEEAEIVSISAAQSISPDPGDDPFCFCAEQGGADFIVTLNARDFPQALLSSHVIHPGEKIPTTARKKRKATILYRK